MRTTKPISTISYNSDEFLQGTLNRLVQAGKVAFWAFVNHIGEDLVDEETGDVEKEKDHKHVYIEPNGKVDTVELGKLFWEFDQDHPNKPLKCINWKSSQWDDWMMYALHDDIYLASKCMERQYAYKIEEFFASDDDELYERYRDTLHSSKLAKNRKLQSMLMKGYSVGELSVMGYIDPSKSLQYAMFGRLFADGTDALACRRRDEEKRRLAELEKRDNE